MMLHRPVELAAVTEQVDYPAHEFHIKNLKEVRTAMVEIETTNRRYRQLGVKLSGSRLETRP